MVFQGTGLRNILLKLRGLTKKDKAWVLREEKEVENLRQMVVEILLLQRYLQQKKYDTAAQHSEKRLFKEVSHENRRLSWVEYRMNRVAKKLLSFLQELLNVEEQLGKQDIVKNIKGSIGKIQIFQRDTVKKVARGGQLQQFIEQKQWLNAKMMIDNVLAELQGMLIIVQELEEEENTIEKETTQEVMGHFQDLEKGTLNIELQIAKFFTQWLNNVFRMPMSVKHVFSNIQYVKKDGFIRISSGGQSFLGGRYFIPSQISAGYLETVLQRTFHFETFVYYYKEKRDVKQEYLTKTEFKNPQNKGKIFEYVLNDRMENGLGFSIPLKLFETEIAFQKVPLRIGKDKSDRLVVRFAGEKDQYYGEYEQNCNRALLKHMRGEYERLQKVIKFP